MEGPVIGLVIALLGLGVAVWALGVRPGRSEDAVRRRALDEATKRLRRGK